MWRINNPAFDPLTLLKAGDIESNPDPRVARQEEDQKCECCGKRTVCGLPCSIPGCKKTTHKQKKCSGQNMTPTMRWFCTEHRGLAEISISSARPATRNFTRHAQAPAGMNKRRSLGDRLLGCAPSVKR